MSNFLYHRPSDRITAGTWSFSTGTARTGYGLTSLYDLDPSAPLWANETSIRIVNDFGSALQVDHVYIFGHNFVNAADLRVQMHTSSSWATPDVNVALTIPTAHLDGFAYNLHADIAAAYPTAGNRTKQFLSIANLSANTVSAAIGEVVIVASSRRLARNIRLSFVQARQHLTARSTSKRGVATVYDYGSVMRGIAGSIPATLQDIEDLRTLEEDARFDALPWVFTLDSSNSTARIAEPVLVRFTASPALTPYQLSNYHPVTFQVEELGSGEIVGA